MHETTPFVKCLPGGMATRQTDRPRGRRKAPAPVIRRRALLIFFGFWVAMIGACALLLPERYRVNAPLGELFGADVPQAPEISSRLRVPDGLGISLYADELPNARMLRMTATGDLLVSSPRTGRVHLVEADSDGDGRADGTRVLLADLDRPHGLELWRGWLYVAEGAAVARVRFDAVGRRTEGPLERIVSGLPEGGNHWTRTVRMGPDEGLYVGVGSSCNVCVEQDSRRAALLRYEPDGSGEEIYATGLRNPVGFDWRPGTDELFATDNGRDLLGDDFPPCELNRIEAGGFYGWPHANGDRVPDPDLGAGHEARIASSIPPAHSFRAHNAPLGITFLRAQPTAGDFDGAAIVALHGSWNRTRKDGYKVVSLHWSPDGSVEERDFVVGFEFDGDVIGRPVDVAEGPDGSIFISDDYTGVIWRVAAGASATAGAALYDQNGCAACHDLENPAPGVVPVALVELPSRYTRQQLATFFTAPTPPMPLYPLSAEQRADLAAYLLHRFD